MLVAQNSPPVKPESDCTTTMCTQGVVAPVHHDQAPLWAVELIMFTIAVLVLLLAYRFVFLRRRVAS